MKKQLKNRFSRLAVLASSLVIAANASAQAPPVYWVQFATGYVLSSTYVEGDLLFLSDLDSANLSPSGVNQWNAAVSAEVQASEIYPFGARSICASYVGQSTTYPQLMVTDRTNVRSYTVEAPGSYPILAVSRAEMKCEFNCEEYSYIQMSKQYYGYLQANGNGPRIGASAWERKIHLDDTLMWSASGNNPDANEFSYSTMSYRWLIPPGEHSIKSEQYIKSVGILSIHWPGRDWHMHETYQNVGNFALPQSSWWVYPVPNDTVHPSSYQVVKGTQTGGSLASLNASDDNRLHVKFNRVTPIGTVPSAAVSFTSTLPNLPDLALRVYVEASATPANLTQTVSLWNYQTSAFDVVDTRAATSADSFALARTEQISKYVHPNSRQVTCLVRWTPSTVIGRTWTCSIDEVKLMAFRR